MRPLHAFVILALLASACSSGEEVGPLALFDDTATTVDAVTSTQSMSTSTTAPTTTEQLATSTTDDSADEDSSANGGTSPATTPRGSEAAAPNGGRGEPADVMSLYTGVLGTYGINQVLAVSPVAMPTVASGVSPLTGLPSSRAGTSAMVVKIDNSSKARPQAGLDQADIVIEQEVEGGLTRFAAIFQSSAPERIGPVRSARSTDISFLSALGRPGLVYSGANGVFDTLIIRQERVRNYSAARFGGYWRDNSRRAPSNLYTSMSQFSTAGAPPPAWFHFGTQPNSGGVSVTSFVARFPATSVSWTWNGSAWSRAQDGRNHTSESGGVLTATNVVVAQIPIIDSGLKDPTGAFVPEFIWAGEGPVAVFTNGRRIDGQWIRPTLGDPAVLVDANGAVIELAPGNTWVELTRTLP